MKSFIKINPSDNVAVALQPLAKGTVIKLDNSTLTLTEEIMQGHKFALKSLKPGDSIIKYGNPIGRATAEIPAGFSGSHPPAAHRERSVYGTA